MEPKRIVAAIASLLFCLASPTYAQILPVQGLAGKNYESHTGSKTCNGSTCYVFFPQNTTGLRIVVDIVLCNATSDENAPIQYGMFGIATGDTAATQVKTSPLYIVQSTVFSTVDIKVLKGEPQIVLGTGRYPMIKLVRSASSFGNVTCSLGGTLVEE